MDNQFDLVEELSVKFIFGYLISIECHNVTYLITPLFWGCFDYRFKAFVEELFSTDPLSASVECFPMLVVKLFTTYTFKWKQSDENYQIF